MNGQPQLSRIARLNRSLEAMIFAHRRLVLLLLLGITLLLARQASQLTLEAAFDRAQPARHPFTQVDLRHRDVVDGASPVRIAVLRKAFSDACADPELVLEGDKTRRYIEPIDGVTTQKMIEAVYKTSPEVIAKIRSYVKPPAAQ